MKPLHLDNSSMDGSQLNLDALYQIAPSCFTEVRDDRMGELKHKVDFDALRSLLGDSVADEGDEMYQFTWPGKREAKREAARQIDKTLRPIKEDSVDWDTTENLYIEGDNLDALKLLQRSYLGKVKMIYIDPPYNTGNDFIYNDDFSQSAADYDAAAGNVDELGRRYRRNTDSNGRFHSDWCSMIYSRLLVARTLLTEDGVIFISIGVEELQNLKAICNEVFGEANFVEIFSWVKTSTPPSLATKSRKTNEYVLCYEKNKNSIKYNGVALDGGDAPLLNSSNGISTLTFPHDKVLFKTTKFPDGHYNAFSSDKVSLLDDIDIENGYAKNDFRLQGRFKWSQDFLREEIENGTTFIIKTDELSIRFIRSGEGYKRPTNFIKDEIISPVINKPINGVGTNETASSHLNSLMDGLDVFSYPKPVSLIKYLINFIVGDHDIVMDFFSGSGTTAESVWQQCLSGENTIHIRFILVQLPENLDESLKKADPNSRQIIENGIKFLDKYRKPHFITELAKERIRRAGKKIKADSPLITQDLDTGFRVLRIDESNYENVKLAPQEYDQLQLDFFADNIRADRTDMDLLFGCLTSWGLPLSLPMESETVDGCTVFTVNGGDLVACFSENVTEQVCRAIAEKHPLRIVFRDSCFSEDKQKINIFEQFKQLLDWSEEEALANIRVI